MAHFSQLPLVFFGNHYYGDNVLSDYLSVQIDKKASLIRQRNVISEETELIFNNYQLSHNCILANKWQFSDMLLSAAKNLVCFAYL